MRKKINPKDVLWALCQQFIEENEVSCSETIYQSDHVISNAYDFIKNMCDVVGYYQEIDNEDDVAYKDSK